eukprot:scaffold14.g1353.t1
MRQIGAGLPAPFATHLQRPRAQRRHVVVRAATDAYVLQKLEEMERTHAELQSRMADPAVSGNNAEYQRVARAVADIQDAVDAFAAYREAERQLAAARELLRESEGAGDAEMAELAREEIAALQGDLDAGGERLKLLLLPRDPLDERNIMLETFYADDGRFGAAPAWPAALHSGFPSVINMAERERSQAADLAANYDAKGWIRKNNQAAAEVRAGFGANFTRPPAAHRACDVAQVLRASGFLTPEAHVLDLGCGTGQLAEAIVGDVASVTGLDSNAAMLALFERRAAAHGSRMRCLRCDITDERAFEAAAAAAPPPPPPLQYDLACTSMCFHHLAPEGLLRLARRHLRPGGHIVALDFEKGEGSHRFHTAATAKSRAISHFGGLTREQMVGYLQGAGFKGASCRQVHRFKKPCEVRAGTGGEEAALWAADLIRMYQKYADGQGWKVSLLSESTAEAGGYKECILQVTGDRVYSKLKYESGVHRVQRVPATETSGRVHTSTATVAVMPEVDDVDVKIDAKEERSQGRNRERAMALLRAKLFELELEKQRSEVAARRRSQVGTGSRSEKIKTYNYKDSRMSDHRTKNNYDLNKVLEGGLEESIQATILMDQQEQLRELAEQPS